MNAAAPVLGPDSGVDLLSLFERHHDALGGQPEGWRRQRLVAVRAFLEDCGDLTAWMAACQPQRRPAEPVKLFV